MLKRYAGRVETVDVEDVKNVCEVCNPYEVNDEGAAYRGISCDACKWLNERPMSGETMDKARRPKGVKSNAIAHKWLPKNGIQRAPYYCAAARRAYLVVPEIGVLKW